MELASTNQYHVIIDSNIYKKYLYDVEHSHFKTMRVLNAEFNFHLYTSKIIRGEVIGNLKKDCSSAQNRLNSSFGKVPIYLSLRDQEVNDAIAFIKGASLLQGLKESLNELFREMIELPLDTVDLDSVLQTYFSSAPPFNKKNKKAEFPDSFIASQIKALQKRISERVFLISMDTDFKEAFQDNDMITCVKEFEEFFTIIHKENKLYQDFSEIIENNDAVFEKQTQAAFEYSGFYLADEEGDVLDVAVSNVEVLDKYITDFSETEATVSLDIMIEFLATVEYDDVSSATYDHESGTYFNFDTVKQDVEEANSYPVEFKVVFAKNKVEKVVLSNFNNGKDIGVYLSADRF